MTEFLQALVRHTFLQHALVAGILASLACGITGTYVVMKRIVFISGGIAHAVLGGMGIAYFLGLNPLIGATLFALVAAVVLGLIKTRAHQHEDTLIGALWAVGMAIGIIFIHLTPGYSVDLMSFLFGNILMVGRDEILIMLILNTLIILLVMLFYRQFLAVCFDEDHAALRGIRVEAVYILLLCLVALTVVLLIQVVGLLLVIALLTLPAAIAALFVRRLFLIMVTAVLIGILCTLAGLVFSYSYNLPTGAAIILLAGAVYICVLSGQKLKVYAKRRRYKDC